MGYAYKYAHSYINLQEEIIYIYMLQITWLPRNLNHLTSLL